MRSSPNNAILFDIAPLSLAFETFSPGERFFTLTNHEITHVATMDVWNSQDAFWRRLFADARLPQRRHVVLQHYTIAVLAGLASTLMLEGAEVALRPAVVELLKENLTEQLGRGVRAQAS